MELAISIKRDSIPVSKQTEVCDRFTPDLHDFICTHGDGAEAKMIAAVGFVEVGRATGDNQVRVYVMGQSPTPFQKRVVIENLAKLCEYLECDDIVFAGTTQEGAPFSRRVFRQAAA